MAFNFTTDAPILAALSAASERLVESLKKLIPGLSQTKVTTTSTAVEGDQTREGILSLLSIVCATLTAWLACCQKILGDGCDFGCIALYGLMIAGGSRLWNPLVEWLKAVKDAKKSLPNA